MRRGIAESIPHIASETADVEVLGKYREKSWIATSYRGLEVLRYNEGNALLRDPRFVKGPSFLYRLDKLGVTSGPIRRRWEQMLSTVEDDKRVKLRMALSKLLGPKQIQLLHSTVAEIVGDLLAAFDDGDEVDLLNDVCWRLPPLVYCRLTGAPASEASNVARLADGIMAPLLTSDPSRLEEHLSAFADTFCWLEERISAARHVPDGNFTSALIAQGDAGLLTADEVAEEAFTILIGSIDNTVHQAALILGTLLERPDLWRRLVRQPEKAADAVEETIRWRPRFGTLFRLARQSLSLGDVEVGEGEYVFVSVRAAHRDPRAFEAPDLFDLDRVHNTPLMFGNGPYRCLGQHLARLELNELTRQVIQRFPTAEPSGEMNVVDTDAVTQVERLVAGIR